MVKIRKTMTMFVAAAFLLSCLNIPVAHAGAVYSLSGYVTDASDGSIIPDVQVKISGDKEASAVSDASGYYQIDNIPGGSKINASASKAGYASASPVSKITNFDSDKTVNFTMTRIAKAASSSAAGVVQTQSAYAVQTKPFFAAEDSSKNDKKESPKPAFTVSGKVTYYASGLVGVKVMVNNDRKLSAVTDVNGYYSVSGIKSGQKYTLSFSKDGFTFNPSESEISGKGFDVTVNSEGVPSTYKIYGTILDGKYKIEGVEVKAVSGVDERTAITDKTGFYAINNLAYGNNFTVTAYKNGVVITPLKVNVNKLDNDRQINFSALVRKFNISGKVAGTKDKPLKKAAVELKTPYDKLTALTSSKGAFMFEDVPEELSYDLTASKEGYLSDTVNIRSLDSDQTLNFKLQPDDGSGQTYAQPESSSGSDIQAALKENTAQADKETKAAEEKQRKVKEREEAAVRKAQEKEEAAAKKAQEKEAAAAAEREKEIAAAREKEAAAERKAQEEAAVKEKPRRVRGLRTVKKTDEEKQPAQTASAQQPSSSDSLITPSEKTPQVKKEKEVAAPQSKEKKIKIKGRVGTKTENMQGIELTLQPGGYKTSSDEKGRYSFDVPAPSGKYVLTPAAADFYFDPESADISGAASAVTQDFSPYVQLEGTVYAEKKPVGGASIQIGGVQTAVTDELGRFKTEKIEYGSPASVTVAKQGYIFYPVSFEYAKLDKNYQNLNFITAYSVSGKITAQGSGFGLSNVTVAVSGASETSVMADYGGNFVIPGLESGGTFTITPKAGGFSFTPASRDVANLNGNVIGQNFTAVKRTFTIKGNVNVAGKPIKNAIVSITKRALKYFTDDNGNFEMAGLDYGGPYTVSVESREHAFSPIVINVLSEDMEIEFSTDISLGGTVVSGGKPVAGVTVDVNGKKTKTDENGKFVMTGLRYEGDYLLSLSGPGMMFSPLKREYNQVRQSMLNEVFEASLLIGGTVSAADGRPVGGVEFTVSGDTAAYKSDDNGFYIIQNLKAGRDYTVTPASQDFTFSPPKRQYKNISAGSLSDNFKAVKKKFLTQDQ